MAVFFTNDAQSGISLTSNDDLWINQSSAIVSNEADAFAFNSTSNNRLIVQGIVASNMTNAISSLTASASLVVEIGISGFVSGSLSGIDLQGTGHQVVNYGTVDGLFGNGITLEGAGQGANLKNGSSVLNGGSISAEVFGIESSGPSVFINNTGKISVSEGTGVILERSSGSTVVNSGIISGKVGGVGIDSPTGTTNTVRNSGTIIVEAAGGSAIGAGGGNEVVENSGTLAGGVALEGGDDQVVNTGTITDVVDLDDGNDLYRAFSGGTAALVLGGTGIDTLTGSVGEDVFQGEAGADTLRGAAGDDNLDGGSGADLVRGGSGDDTLTGNRGSDTLVGGGGRDDFVILSGVNADSITDFAAGTDKLDLTALGFATVADALADGKNVDGNVVFTFASNDVVTILNVTLNEIAADIII